MATAGKMAPFSLVLVVRDFFPIQTKLQFHETRKFKILFFKKKLKSNQKILSLNFGK